MLEAAQLPCVTGATLGKLLSILMCMGGKGDGGYFVENWVQKHIYHRERSASRGGVRPGFPCFILFGSDMRYRSPMELAGWLTCRAIAAAVAAMAAAAEDRQTSKSV